MTIQINWLVVFPIIQITSFCRMQPSTRIPKFPFEAENKYSFPNFVLFGIAWHGQSQRLSTPKSNITSSEPYRIGFMSFVQYKERRKNPQNRSEEILYKRNEKFMQKRPTASRKSNKLTCSWTANSHRTCSRHILAVVMEMTADGFYQPGTHDGVLNELRSLV